MHGVCVCVCAMVHQADSLTRLAAEEATAAAESRARAAQATCADLRTEAEALRLLHFEDRRQALAEHTEVVHALQTHFDEYRSTAEAVLKVCVVLVLCL